MKSILLILLSSISIIGFSQIDTNGLIGYYKLNGNLIDSSNYLNNASCNNPNFTNDAFGKSNSAIYFDSTSEPVVLGNSSFNFKLSSKFTIAATIYATETGLYHTILAKNEEYKKTGYTFGFGNNNELRFNTDLSYSVSAPSPFPKNVWVYVALVYDGGNVSLYQNGILQKSGSIVALNQNSYNLILGRIYNSKNGYNFHGSIDNILIYNRALLDSDVKKLFYTINSITHYVPDENNKYTIVSSNNNIIIKTSDLTPYQIRIISPDGKILKYAFFSGEGIIDLNGTSSGIYYVYIESKTGFRYSKKILIY